MGHSVILISGASAVGKSTLINSLVEVYVCRFELAFTSRDPRPGEVHGQDYWFLSASEFQERILSGRIFAWDFVLGNYYGFEGTLLDTTSGPVVTHILARFGIRLCGGAEKCKGVFLEAANRGVLEARLRERYGECEELTARLQHGREEQRHKALFEYAIRATDEARVMAQKLPLWEELGLLRRSAL